MHSVLVAVALAAFPSVAPQNLPPVSRETVDCAYSEAQLLGPYVPPPLATVSRARCPFWGSTSYDDDGDAVLIKLYTHSYRARTPQGTGSFSQSFLKGAMLRTLIHELRHACMGHMGGCHNKGKSCLHAMIDSYVHDKLCYAAQEALEDLIAAQNAGDEDAAEEARGKLDGICDSSGELEEKWNNEDGVAAVNACKNGTADCPLSDEEMMHATSQCGLEMPCPPEPGSGAPEDEILTPCAACQ